MSRVISSTAGTRTEPKDSYEFLRGGTAIFKTIFTTDDRPTRVDTATTPFIRIFKPIFLNQAGVTSPEMVAQVNGTLTTGQDFEYQFVWDIPASLNLSDEYIVSYYGTLAGSEYNFGDEYFTVKAHNGTINMKTVSYATVDDVRKKKFNIDSYLPDVLAKDLDARNNIIQDHLDDAAVKLRESLALFQQRGYSENYRLFCIYQAIWSILLASRGEDGSAVSDQNIMFWKNEADKILEQSKMRGRAQGLSFGRN